ncbi:MAG: TadE/TadG family type IV pilus assembly protein [Planctomycetaceae bacterium]
MTRPPQRGWNSGVRTPASPGGGDRPRNDPRSFRPYARSGAVALEFAAVLPVMLLVLVGILEFGRVGSLGIRLAQAARAGAEYGAFHPPDQETMADWARVCEARAREVLASEAGVDLSQFEIQCTYTTGSPLGRVQVVVRHPFPLLAGWSSAPGNLQLQRSAVLPVIR